MRENNKSKIDRRHAGNIHINFFRTRFQVRAQIGALLKLALSPEELRQLDLRSLRLEPGRWTKLKDDRFSSRETDLQVSARLRGGAKVTVSIVIEHKSDDDPDLMAQLLRYQAGCFERGAPAVVPLALYHGRTKGFPKWKTFQQYQRNRLQVPAGLMDCLSGSMIDFKPLVIDLTDEATGRRLAMLPLAAELSLWMMKNVWRIDWAMFVELVNKSFRLPARQRMPLVRECAIYLCDVRREYKIGDLMRYINEQLPGDSAMQELAKEWNWVKRPDIVEEGKRIGLKEGRQIGQKEGRQIGQKEGQQQKALDIAEKLLRKDLSVEEISSITGLDAGQIDGLRNHN